jgi:hypothetical protein
MQTFRFLAAATAVLAVALLCLTGLASPSAAGPTTAFHSAGPVTDGAHGLASVRPSGLATTVIDLNRSQSGGTYVAEYVTVNNGTTLHILPASLTVTAGACDWITIQNLTVAATPASSFHNVQYRNVTIANASSTVKATMGTHSFDICGGSGWWINFVYWSFSIYDFTSTTLPVNGSIGFSAFSDWPGTSTAPPAFTANFGTSSAVSARIASNLTTFTVTLPTLVNGSTTCTDLSQVCSFEQYSFVSATDTANLSTSRVIVFSTASGLRVSGTWENWTVGYSAASISANTGTGAFFADTSTFVTEVFVQYYYLWILAVIVLIIVGVAASGSRRRGGKRE